MEITVHVNLRRRGAVAAPTFDSASASFARHIGVDINETSSPIEPVRKPREGGPHYFIFDVQIDALVRVLWWLENYQRVIASDVSIEWHSSLENGS